MNVEIEATYDRPIRTEYRLLADYRLSSPEAPIRDIAKLLGYSYQAVRAWLLRPDYQRYEAWLHKHAFAVAVVAPEARQVQETFQEYAGEMQERLLAILDESRDERLITQIAHDWLDRAGHSPVRKQMSAGVTMHLTAEAVMELQRREREAGLGNPLPESGS